MGNGLTYGLENVRDHIWVMLRDNSRMELPDIVKEMRWAVAYTPGLSGFSAEQAIKIALLKGVYDKDLLRQKKDDTISYALTAKGYASTLEKMMQSARF